MKFNPNLYTPAYYERHRTKYHNWQRALAIDIITRYNVRSMLDLGCGVGSFLSVAVDRDLPAMGVEYNLEAAAPHIPEHVRPHIVQGDVTKPLGYRGYDLTWSTEVAEHIEPSGSWEFANNLTKSTDRMILLTAAPPGQGGTGHINRQPQEYWIDLISCRGFRIDRQEVAKTKTIWTKLKCPGYMTRNLMIFFPR